MDAEIMQSAGRLNGNNIDFQLWRQDNHPIELATANMIHQKLDYIHNNPVEAGFVESPEYYLYSSARDYYDLPSLLPGVVKIDPIVAG